MPLRPRPENWLQAFEITIQTRGHELLLRTFAKVFASQAIRVQADSEVTPDSVRCVLSRCKSLSGNARCELLHALLVTGRAQPADFPADMPVGF